MKEKLLLFSVLVNLLLGGILGYIISKRGGITFLKMKMGPGKMVDSGYGPYYDQRRTLFDILPRDSGDILFVGHSLIDGCEWAELLDNPKVKNRGINGELAEGILKRLDALINPPPAKMFIMTGANDLGHNKSTSAILNDFRMILDTLKLLSPSTDVYLVSLLPNGIGNNKSQQAKIVQLNTGLKKLADNYAYAYIDLYSVVKDDNNRFNSSLSNDGSHLTGQGYLKISQKLKEYMD